MACFLNVYINCIEIYSDKRDNVGEYSKIQIEQYNNNGESIGESLDTTLDIFYDTDIFETYINEGKIVSEKNVAHHTIWLLHIGDFYVNLTSKSVEYKKYLLTHNEKFRKILPGFVPRLTDVRSIEDINIDTYDFPDFRDTSLKPVIGEYNAKRCKYSDYNYYTNYDINMALHKAYITVIKNAKQGIIKLYDDEITDMQGELPYK